MDQAKFDALRAQMRAGKLKTVSVEETTPEMEANIMAGELVAEVFRAVRVREVGSREAGDWLDDPVAGVLTGDGFGEEVAAAGANRFQINLGLDVSGSMFGSGLNVPAAYSMRVLYRMLKIAEQEVNQYLKVKFYFWAGAVRMDSDGKWNEGIYDLEMDPIPSSGNSYYDASTKYFGIGEVDKVLKRVSKRGGWSAIEGSNTQLVPAMNRIFKWEQAEDRVSDRRLDIFLTDGLIGDTKDELQAAMNERGGNQQTVILNFLHSDSYKEERWDLPARVWMYNVSPTSLRQTVLGVISEFVNRAL